MQLLPQGILVHDWLHLSKAFTRKIVGVGEDEDVAAMDLQAGYSRRTAWSTYGVTTMGLRGHRYD